MDKIIATRAVLALVIFVLGSLQAWASGVSQAGLLIVSLVSLAIALPPVALLVPLKQANFSGAFALSVVHLATSGTVGLSHSIARATHRSCARSDRAYLHRLVHKGSRKIRIIEKT